MTQTQRRHRGVWIGIGLSVLVLGVGGLLYARPVPALYPVNKLSTAAPQLTPLSWPASGEAAVGAVGYGVLASSSNQTPKPTASIAKLITALTVLQKYPLAVGQSGPSLNLTPADVALYNAYNAKGGSTVTVVAGEQLTEYQALEAMLLPSANNVADSLAIWAFGSLANYQAAASQLLQKLGLTNTIVGSDASGFDPSTLSTPSDLVKLGEAAISQAVIAQIVSQMQASLPVVGVVHNVNWLLGQDGVIGVKTGNSDQENGAYVFAANDTVGKQQIVIVGAIMNAPDLQAAISEAVPLLNATKANFTEAVAVRAGQTVATYQVPWGSTVDAVAQATISFASWHGTPLVPVPTLHALYAPLAPGTVAGSLNFTGSSTGTTVILRQAISAPPWWWRIVRHKL